MNEVKTYLLQIFEEKSPELSIRRDWEVMIAKGSDGLYFGKAKCPALGANADSYPWIETKTSDLERAAEFMKGYCEQRTKS
ncbi:hypothetical protein [Paenibacillus chibensis]|uniref:hypothetical protein n=1 Tax=Paenibacillus chibensis TaxID=59846 RepID=UPI000FD9B669|nr:hypothetical protein [Paenibacillus chibensis]MEC0372321.1 hypothetical protein [Paenibacillus chibensis]